MKPETIVSRVQLTSVGVPYEWVATRFGGRAELPASRLAKDAHPTVASFLRRQGYEGDIEELAVEAAAEKPSGRSDEPEKAAFLEATGPLRHIPPSWPVVHVTAVDRAEVDRWPSPGIATGPSGVRYDATVSDRWHGSGIAHAPPTSARVQSLDMPYGGYGSFTRYQPARQTLGGLLTLAPRSSDDMLLEPAQGAFQPESAVFTAHSRNALQGPHIVWRTEDYEILVRNLDNEPTPLYARSCSPENPLRLTFENRGNEPAHVIVTVFGQMVR